MSRQLFLFLCLCGLCISTSFTQRSDRITMLYQETVCPPAWNNYYSTDSTFFNLKQLLKEDSIEVFKIKYTGKMFEMTCAGCQCLTGRNIEITIGIEDLKRAEEHRFYRPWVWMEKIEFVCDWTIKLDDQQIFDELQKKDFRLQGLYCLGPSEEPPNDCSKPSGRTLVIRIDIDDQKMAEKEGFKIKAAFTEY